MAYQMLIMDSSFYFGNESSRNPYAGGEPKYVFRLSPLQWAICSRLGMVEALGPSNEVRGCDVSDPDFDVEAVDIHIESTNFGTFSVTVAKNTSFMHLEEIGDDHGIEVKDLLAYEEYLTHLPENSASFASRVSQAISSVMKLQGSARAVDLVSIAVKDFFQAPLTLNAFYVLSVSYGQEKPQASRANVEVQFRHDGLVVDGHFVRWDDLLSVEIGDRNLFESANGWIENGLDFEGAVQASSAASRICGTRSANGYNLACRLVFQTCEVNLLLEGNAEEPLLLELTPLRAFLDPPNAQISGTVTSPMVEFCPRCNSCNRSLRQCQHCGEVFC